MIASTLIRQAAKVYTDGDPDLKLAATGVAVLWAGISEAAATLLAALVALFWLCDMVSGTLRAIARDGLHSFSMFVFFGGFAKFTAAAVGIFLSVGLDLWINDGFGIEQHYLTTAAMTLVAFGFGSSAAQNIAHWWPSLAALLERGLGRARDTQPTDGHD